MLVLKTKAGKLTNEGFVLYQDDNVECTGSIIYNLNRLELESYEIYGREKVNVEISAWWFPYGTYHHALVATYRY